MEFKFENESYECPSCSGPIGFPDETNNWQCASCGSYLLIYANIGDNFDRVYDRVPTSQLAVGDLVLLRGESTYKPNEVLAISIEPGGHYSVALKEYRRIKVASDTKFNRVQGTR